MQGIRKKQQKNEKNRALCRVYAHGKGLLVTLPCAHARQRSHVAAACRPGKLLGLACRGLCRACWRAGARQSQLHGTELPHGNAGPHGNELAARQRWLARQTCARTAKVARTAKRLPHGSPGRARQRPLPCKLSKRTAKAPLPSVSLPSTFCRACTHGKGFAVHLGAFAVQCAARQCLLFP